VLNWRANSAHSVRLKGARHAWAKRYLGHGGRVSVVTGDGELQRQNDGTAIGCPTGVTNLTMIIDHNSSLTSP
jgi:transketolase N-terminal domain/subunit